MSFRSRLPQAILSLGMLFLLLASEVRAAESVTLNDTARILAGLQPSAGSALENITRDRGWQAHARNFDTSWARLETVQLSKIRDWSAATLTARKPVLFYKFSGPDFLYANAFFPDADTYVLSGLEPTGQVPTMTDTRRRSLPYALSELRSSLNSIISYSFFQTIEMRGRLGGGGFTGTLPIIYIFMARSGKTIEETTLVSLDAEGAVVPVDDPKAQASVKGAKIVFTGAARDGVPPRKQTLYYFQTDVSNRGLANSPFLAFCEKLGTGDALVKSASFLMYSNNFSRVREFLLEHAETILQDDSGIPVQYFKAGDWELKPYGRYLGPIPLFAQHYQRGLAHLFRVGNPPRLEFGIGYRWQRNESNLLLARRMMKVGG